MTRRKDKEYKFQLRIAAAKKTKEKDYWLNKLWGEPVKSSFPAHYNYKGERAEAGARAKVSLKFPDKLSAGLLKLVAGSDARLYIILAASLTILINKYTGRNDIIVGTPILKTDIKPNLINTVLALRNQLTDNMTVKELLLEVQQTILEANKNRNYPVEVLIEQLNLPLRDDDFPLFDVAILVENVHDKEHLCHVNPNMVFSFLRTGETVTGYVEYNSLLYNEPGVKQVIDHFRNLLGAVIERVDIKAVDIEILTGEEKKQLLIDFNDTFVEYPGEKTIHELFEEQAERTPDGAAVVGARGTVPLPMQNVTITYNELNRRSGQLADRLRSKRAGSGAIVGIMTHQSIELIVGILGILKAGAAYLPIDPQYPEERIKYMLRDSRAGILVSELSEGSKVSEGMEVIKVNSVVGNRLACSAAEDLLHLSPAPATSLAYIIYTSGTTGKPKGVMVEHRALINLCLWHIGYYGVKESDHAGKYAGIGFDASVWEIFPYLIKGASLYIIDDAVKLDIEKLNRFFERSDITISFLPTQFYEQFMEVENRSLRTLLAGGDKLRRFKKKSYDLYNNYGPTENTVVSTSCLVEKYDANIPIGKPIANNRIYIFDRSYLHLQPIGVVGELCIGGAGLSRGYLNSPGLTAEKFLSGTCTSGKIYKTGDLARWLPNGNIEFFGRMDNQVKIRGFRIELGEIESHLLMHEEIKEAVVISKEDRWGIHRYLCGYFVPVSDRELSAADLRQYLSGRLPDYMIPANFVPIDKIPLTPNGKVDRKALPEPEITVGKNYVPPGDQIERELVKIWSQVLSKDALQASQLQESIGIDDNFFELGGHSLRATALIAKIYKTFSINVTLANLFKKPTIKGLAEFIKEETPDEFAAVEPVEEKDYYLLTPAQKRIYILQQSDIQDMSYNMPQVMELEGEPAGGRLEDIFKKLIERHESFRTSFEMKAGVPVQRIHNQVEFEVEHFSAARSAESGEFRVDIIQRFVRPFDLSRPPLLRVGLINLDKGRHILMVDMHHCITDGSSMGIFVQEFMALQAGKGLPPLQLQYKDFSAWVNSKSMREAIEKQGEYWLKEFEKEVPTLRLFADEPDFYSHSQSSSPGRWNLEGKQMSFQLDRPASEDLKKLAKEEGVTVYMALLAIYNVLLFKASRQEDIVVGTVTAGRSHPDLQPVIGMFVNTLALRNYPGGEKTFREFLKEVKEQILEAFENQAYPFEELAEKAAANRGSRRNPLFDVMFTLQDLDIPNVEIPGLTLKPYEYENVISKFDLSLNGVEVDDKFVFSFEYRTDRFKEEAIADLADHYHDIIADVLKDRDVKLADIKLSVDLSDSEADAKAYQEAYGDFEF